MKRIFLAAVMAVTAFQVHAAPERVGDFTLIDHNGDAHQLSKYAFNEAVVFISQATACANNRENVAPYKVLRTNWEHRGVSFFMINSSAEDTRDTIRQEDSVWNYDIPILIDRTQLVADYLDLDAAGEIAIVDPDNMQLLYRGPMIGAGADEDPLRDALTAAVEGTELEETVRMDSEPAENCALEFPAKEQYSDNPPDYETEVAPILVERCVGCHVEGGIGPFAMNSHQMVQGWSPMMREVIMTRRMPPAQVDPDVKHWYNARNMPIEETQKLIHWINAGAPRE